MCSMFTFEPNSQQKLRTSTSLVVIPGYLVVEGKLRIARIFSFSLNGLTENMFDFIMTAFCDYLRPLELLEHDLVDPVRALVIVYAME